MANLLSVLNERIRRVARREIRGQTQKTRRLTAQHRRDLAALKRQVAALVRTVAFLEKQEQRRVASPPAAPQGQRGPVLRAKRQGPARPSRPFGKGLWQARGRLGADDLLLGVRQVAAEEEAVAGSGSGSASRQARGATSPRDDQRQEVRTLGRGGRIGSRL